MSDTPPEQCFKLIFEGTEDSSIRTMQRVKGAFIADLEFPVSDVQHILQNAPLEIYKTSSEESIKHYYETLKAAGAKVLLVRPITPINHPDGQELVIDFANNAPERKSEQAPAVNKVYTLDVDDVLFGTTDVPSPEATQDENSAANTAAIDAIKQGVVSQEDEELFPGIVPIQSPTQTNLPGDLFLLDEFAKEEKELQKVDRQDQRATNASHAIEIPASPPPAAHFPPTAPSPVAESIPLTFQLDEQSPSTPQASQPTPPPPSPSAPSVASNVADSKMMESVNLALAEAPVGEELLESAVDKHTSEVEFDLKIESDEPPKSKVTPPPAKVEKVPVIAAAPPKQSTIPTPAAIDLATESGLSVDAAPEEPVEATVPPAAASAPPRKAVPPPPTDIESYTIPDQAVTDDLPLAELQSKMQEINQGSAPKGEAQSEGVTAVSSEIATEGHADAVLTKKGSNKEYIIAFVLCAALLVGGNFVRGLISSDESDEDRFKFNPELNSSSGGSAQGKTKAAPIIERVISASLEAEGKKLTFTLTAQYQEGVLIGVRGPVVVEFPAQVELTPEEIIHNKVRPLWIRKIEASTFEVLPASDKQIRILGPAKLYVELDGGKMRAVGRLQFEFAEPTDESTLHYRAVLFNEVEIDKIKQEIPVVRSRDGSLSFAFIFEGDGKFEIKKNDEEKDNKDEKKSDAPEVK